MENNLFNRLVILLLFLIAVNLFILDLKVFTYKPTVKVSELKISDTQTPTPIINEALKESETQKSNNICPPSCISLINEATFSSASVGSSPIIIKETVTSQTSQTSQTKEYYIPLGSGNTNKSDWNNIIATETIIDPANYGKIKEAYFIASFSNPTQNGQVEAQLINVTDNHPVWGSHVVMNGPVSQTITSDKITLSNGAKLYRAQLKSTMSYQAYLDNAKIRIVTE